MKKNRHLLFQGLFLLVMAAFTFSTVNAQEKKEEKKIIKLKMMADDDGNVTVDTTFILDDAEILVEVEEMMDDVHNINVKTIDGDSTMIYVIKSSDSDDNVMVWTSDGDESETHDIIMKKLDGDSTITIVTVINDDEHEVEHMKKQDVYVIKSGGKVKMKGSDTGKYKIIETKGHKKGAVMTSVIVISEASAEEKMMLDEAGVDMGKDPLFLKDFEVGKDSHANNIKIEFTAREMKNISISLYDKKGDQLFLEELKSFDGKYIREIEILDNEKGVYFINVQSGRESFTKKISLK